MELLGLEPERVEVVHMGVDLERFTPEPAAIDERLPAELGLPDRFLVYPANLWPHKNHHRLVEALARARDRELGLVLTGRDYGRLEALMAEASSLGVRHRVLHLGYVERDALPALYRLARGDGVPQPVRGLRRRHRSRPWRAAAPWPPRRGLARRGLRRRRAGASSLSP